MPDREAAARTTDDGGTPSGPPRERPTGRDEESPGQPGEARPPDATDAKPADEAARIAALEDDRRRLEKALLDRTAALVAARESSRQSRLEREKMQRELERATRELELARAKVARVTQNPAVRIALFGLRTLRRAREAATNYRPRRGASRLAERRLKRSILAHLPGAARTTGPHVAIVIVNRDGVGHLRRLLPALESVAYRDVELVLVDNASTDGSVEFVRRHRTRHPVRIVENDENLSFSDANNAVLADIDAELVLFLNNDIRPMESNWLGWMVESVLTEGTVACGARLILPRRRHRGPPTPGMQADLQLQHAGIQFDWLDGMPRPKNVGGPDPSAPGRDEVREVPAATAACLLVRRDALLAIGGMDPSYVYGYEDVDLSLHLRRNGGRIVVDGRAALWHDESATRRRNLPETLARQRQNRDTFYGNWGRSLFRDVLLDRLEGRGFLSTVPPACAIVVATEPDAGGSGPPAAALRDALAGMGWSANVVVAGGEGWPVANDIAVVADARVETAGIPRHVIKIAWIAGPADAWIRSPWIDDFDVVLADTDDAVEAIRTRTAKVARRVPALADRPGASAGPVATALDAALRSWADARRVGILIQADDWERAPTSGDYHFARGLQRQFERRGMPTTVYFRPDWVAPVSTRDDVLIHLWGRYPVRRRPGQTMLLWILYHPELVTDELLAGYDAVLVASDRFAASIAPSSAAPVVALHQATDPERFRPGQPGPKHDLLFVGNSRGVRRPILDDIIPTRHDLAVYGGGWSADLLDPAYLRGSSVPNEVLPGYYASAAIVLNDHWREGADEGFLNNRLYDVLAAGGFVISDEVEGLATEFDGGVVAYGDAAELFRLVERFLHDPAARAAHAERGRRAVLERHTFSHRVDEILHVLDDLEPAPLQVGSHDALTSVKVPPG